MQQRSYRRIMPSVLTSSRNPKTRTLSTKHASYSRRSCGSHKLLHKIAHMHQHRNRARPDRPFFPSRQRDQQAYPVNFYPTRSEASANAFLNEGWLSRHSRVSREADRVGGTASCKSFSARRGQLAPRARVCWCSACWCNLIAMILCALAQTVVLCGEFEGRHIVSFVGGLKMTLEICSSSRCGRTWRSMSECKAEAATLKLRGRTVHGRTSRLSDHKNVDDFAFFLRSRGELRTIEGYSLCIIVRYGTSRERVRNCVSPSSAKLALECVAPTRVSGLRNLA